MTPPITSTASKKSKSKASVQRNLLDQDGFVSPRKTRVTPIKVSKKGVTKSPAASMTKVKVTSPVASKSPRLRSETRKAASPAKVAIAFMSPTKLPVASRLSSRPGETSSQASEASSAGPNTRSPAKNQVTTMKASLLSLSDPFNFFQQSPWDLE